MTKRIRFADTEEDTDGLVLYNNAPFTGVIYGLYEDDDTLESECEYRDGLPHGECKEFYFDGRLKHSWSSVNGQIRGEEYVFYPSGALMRRCTYDCGVELSRIDWDEAGAKIGEWNIDPKSPLLGYIEVRRLREKSGDERK